MTNNVINLREKPAEKQEENRLYLRGLETPEEKAPVNITADPEETSRAPKGRAAPEVKKTALLSWTAKEYEARERGPYWFLTIGGAALVLVIFGVFIQSFFFSIFIALAAVILMVYIKRGPQETEVLITSDGVFEGRSFFDFKDLKSFWVFERQNPPELSLETKRTLIPFLRLPLKDIEVEKLKEILLRFLPEGEHPELISDQIARRLGL